MLPPPRAKRKGARTEKFHVTRPYRRLVAVVLQFLALLIAFPALAAPTHIKPELLVEGPAAPGGQVTLAFLMKPEKGWHGYWYNPGDAGLGLSPQWTRPAGAKAGELAYPVPQTLIGSSCDQVTMAVTAGQTLWFKVTGVSGSAKPYGLAINVQ